MLHGRSTTPRKLASQARSRATVDVLLDATARVLSREGYDRASTNRIAAVAGVSVGSLYQYFPNKEALVAALVGRHNHEMLALLQQSLRDVADLEIGPAVRVLVAAMIKAHRVDPELHRVIGEQVPRMGQLAQIGAIQREIRVVVKAYLEQRRHEIRATDLDLVSFVCVTTVETLTHEMVIEQASMPAVSETSMVEEIAQLILSYLSPVATAQK